MEHLMDQIDIADRIVTMLKENFPRARKSKIDPDIDLYESGIVDSLGFLTILGFIEDEFNIIVNDEDVLPENFASIQALVSYITKLAG